MTGTPAGGPEEGHPLRARSPLRRLTAEEGDALVQIGGYTHPLFTDPDHLAASPFPSRPWPGQALLLLMGGLVEQTGLFDDRVVALLGFESVDFLGPAFDDDALYVEVEELPAPAGGNGRTGRFTWRACREDGTALVTAVAVFLRPRTPAAPG